IALGMRPRLVTTRWAVSRPSRSLSSSGGRGGGFFGSAPDRKLISGARRTSAVATPLGVAQKTLLRGSLLRRALRSAVSRLEPFILPPTPTSPFILRVIRSRSPGDQRLIGWGLRGNFLEKILGSGSGAVGGKPLSDCDRQ